jgi:hypothetical protein
VECSPAIGGYYVVNALPILLRGEFVFPLPFLAFAQDSVLRQLVQRTAEAIGSQLGHGCESIRVRWRCYDRCRLGESARGSLLPTVFSRLTKLS